MATFIDYSFAAEEKRRQRAMAEQRAERERIDAATMAEEQSTLGFDRSLSPTPHTATNFSPALHPSTAGVASVGQRRMLQRLGRWRRVKEVFRPALRNKRIVEKFALSEDIESRVEEPTEPPSLPGAGLLKLQAWEGDLLPVPPWAEEFDADLTRGGDDDEITALPPLPTTHFYRPVPPLSAVNRYLEEEMDEPSVEDLADQAMDEAMAVADSPGNRLSTRPPLPAEWLTDNFGPPRETSNGDLEQWVPPTSTMFLPLPDLSSPGTPLPDPSIPDVRPATAWSG